MSKFEESAIQQGCVMWFRLQYPKLASVLIHVPNEGKRDVKLIHTKYGYRQVCTSASKLKAEGMIAGVADLLLLVPRGPFGCLGIEMKSPKGRLQPSQAEWSTEFCRNGNLYRVCRSLEDFQSVINDYLSLPDASH